MVQKKNKQLSLFEAILPVILLVSLLAWNVYIYSDEALNGSNQFLLLIGAAFAILIGWNRKISFGFILKNIAKNIRSTSSAILILLMVGALSGTWLISGVIPSMVYYGLEILSPVIFLPSCVIICALVSVFTGSSWTTSVTVGIALVGIGNVLNIPLGMVAGAILSGGYFGDKMSPMSDTTNLAPVMAGSDLYTHIRYMSFTTVPTITITLILFIIIGLTLDVDGSIDTQELLKTIDNTFNITPWLFLVPLYVIIMIIIKTPPLIALFAGTIIAAFFALIFQVSLLSTLSGVSELNFSNAYKILLNSITVKTSISTNNAILDELFKSKGMSGMLGTIWLIICAMVFGGAMEAIGALKKISSYLLQLFDSVFGLFASTVLSCITLNATASDQYLAIVVPGKMFSKAFKDKGLAPENLSRTLEDSGTVTSVLIPYNTCGAYQSGVLGVSVSEYFIYAFFNYLSPFMTLLFAALRIKIRMLSKVNK